MTAPAPRPPATGTTAAQLRPEAAAFGMARHFMPDLNLLGEQFAELSQLDRVEGASSKK